MASPDLLPGGALIFERCWNLFCAEEAPRRLCLRSVDMFVLGVIAIQIAGSSEKRDTTILRFATNREVILVADVTDDGLVRDSGFGEQRQVLEIKTEQVSDGRDVLTTAAGLRITLYARRGDAAQNNAAVMPSFSYGQRLRIRARLRPPRNFRNPGAFDYRGYLAERGIVARGSANVADVEVLPGFVGSRIAALRKSVRRSVLGKVSELWPAPKAALIDAMVIGEAAFLDRDTRVDFQRSGTYHVLVVSGMNLAILAFVIFWLLRRLRVGEVWASVLTVLLSFGYASLCDWGAPILRAAFMLSLYLGTRLLYRDRSGLNAIGGAMIGVLLVDPKALLGASFQLTFLAVLAIAGIGVPLLEHTSQPYRRALRSLESVGYDRSFLPKLAQFRLDVRLISGKLSRFMGVKIAQFLVSGASGMTLAAYEVMLISALMQIVLALPMAYYFHRATTLGLPANVLVVPLTECLMPAAVAAVALAYVSQTLALIPAWIAGLALEGISGTVRFLGGFRLADVRVPMPNLVGVVAGVLAIALALVLARQRFRIAAIGLALLVASAAWLTHFPPHPATRVREMEMTAIDVGEGDSILVVSPQGKTLLVDGGGPLGPWASEFDYGEDVAVPKIRHLTIGRNRTYPCAL